MASVIKIKIGNNAEVEADLSNFKNCKETTKELANDLNLEITNMIEKDEEVEVNVEDNVEVRS